MLFLIIISLLTTTVCSADDQIALPSVGVSLEKIGEGPNAESLPKCMISIDKPKAVEPFSVSLDTEPVETKLREFELKNIDVSVSRNIFNMITSSVGSLNSLIQKISKLTKSSRHFFDSPSQRRKKRFGGLIGGLFSILFGSSGNSDDKKAIQDLSKGLESTNRAVAADTKALKTLTNLEKSDIHTVNKEISYYHSQFVNATGLLSSAIKNLTNRMNVISHKLELLEMLVYANSFVTHALIKTDTYMLKVISAIEQMDVFVAAASSGKMSMTVVSTKSLRISLEHVQATLTSSTSGISVRYTGKLMSYYYSSSEILVYESDNRYIVTFGVPITTSSTTITWYRVHTWAVTTNPKTLGPSILGLPRCIGVAYGDEQRYIESDCTDLKFGGNNVILTTPGVLSLTSSSKCIGSIIARDSKGVDKNCHYGLTYQSESDFSRIAPSTYIMHGRQTYTVKCYNGDQSSKSCDGCQVKVPCKCTIHTSTTISAISFNNCPDQVSVRFTYQRFTVLHYNNSVCRVPVDKELDQDVTVRLPKRAQLKKDTADVAEINKREYDATKGLNALEKKSNSYLRQSNEDAEDAVNDVHTVHSSYGFDIAVIVLYVLWALTTAYFFYKTGIPFFHPAVTEIQNRIEPAESVSWPVIPEVSETEIWNFEHIMLTTLLIFSTILIVIVYVFKIKKLCRQRNHLPRRVSPELIEIPNCRVIWMVQDDSFYVRKLPTRLTPGHYGVNKVENSVLSIRTNFFHVPGVISGDYEVIVM